MTTAPHPGLNEWFEAVRSEAPTAEATSVRYRCIYCGALVHEFKNGRLASIHAGTWRYHCAARPWWTFGRGHKRKR